MIVGIVRVPSNPPLVFFFLSYLNFSSFFLPWPSSSFSFLADQSSSLIQPLVHAKLDKISSDQGPFTPSILSPILPSKIQSTSQPGQSYEMYAGTYPVIFTCRCTCKMHVHILHTFTCGYLNKIPTCYLISTFIPDYSTLSIYIYNNYPLYDYFVRPRE